MPHEFDEKVRDLIYVSPLLFFNLKLQPGSESLHKIEVECRGVYELKAEQIPDASSIVFSSVSSPCTLDKVLLEEAYSALSRWCQEPTIRLIQKEDLVVVSIHGI
jgi:hypothetical protein